MDKWIVDVPAWHHKPSDVSLHTEDWDETIEIDQHGNLAIFARVDGDACDTNLSVPITKVVEFFAAVGWNLSLASAPPAREGDGR